MDDHPNYGEGIILGSSKLINIKEILIDVLQEEIHGKGKHIGKVEVRLRCFERKIQDMIFKKKMVQYFKR